MRDITAVFASSKCGILLCLELEKKAGSVIDVLTLLSVCKASRGLAGRYLIAKFAKTEVIGKGVDSGKPKVGTGHYLEMYPAMGFDGEGMANVDTRMHYTKGLRSQDGSGIRTTSDASARIRYFTMVSYNPLTLVCHFKPSEPSMHDPALSNEDACGMEDPDLAGLPTPLMFNADGSRSEEFSFGSFNIVSSAWYKRKSAVQLAEDREKATQFNNKPNKSARFTTDWPEAKATIFEVSPRVALPKNAAVQSECAFTIDTPGGLNSNMSTQGVEAAWQDRWQVSFTCFNLTKMFMFDEIFAGMGMGSSSGADTLEYIGLKEAEGGTFVHKISVPLVDLFRVPVVKEYENYNEQYL